MKTCTQCKITKELTEFSPHPLGRDGRQSVCKQCFKVRAYNYRKTINGLITTIYGNQKNNSKDRGHNLPDYTRDELYEWVMSQGNFQAVYDSWVASDFEKDLIPSIDRKDDYQPYTISNLLKVCTWGDNRKRSYEDALNGVNNKNNRAVVQFTLKGELVARYHSCAEAYRCTGVPNIYNSAKTQPANPHRFFWHFEDILLTDNE